MPAQKVFLTMKRWFSGVMETPFRSKEFFSLCGLAAICSAVFGVFMKATERLLLAAVTSVLVLGGSIMGAISGAIRGQTTEAGLLDGAGKGAVTGAIAALQLLDFVGDDEPLSKVALLIMSSLLNGKVFMEWVCPAAAQAYQWHIPETTHREISDIYDVRRVKWLPHNFIQKLPVHQFSSSKMLKLYNESCCSICFQEFEDGEPVRRLPKCGHLFHLHCIDKWLIQEGSCPMCRTFVPDHIDEQH